LKTSNKNKKSALVAKNHGKNRGVHHEKHNKVSSVITDSKSSVAADVDSSRKAINEKMPGKWYPVLSAILLVIIAAFIIYLFVRPSSVEGEKVKVEFYVMSQCPYGVQVEEAFIPVMEKMGDAIDFQLNFIVKESAPGVFQSLHGEKEVKGNIAQLCAKSYAPDKYLKFISCQNKDYANVDTNWDSCAKSVGIDSAKIKSCLESDEGKDLLRTSMQRTMQRGATGSPTIYIADVSYSGPRDALSFQREVCKSSDHSACEGIPKCASDADCNGETGKEGYCINPNQANALCEYKDPVEVNYVILSDKTCTSCDTTRIVQVSQQLFLGGKPKLVDVSSSEGKALVEKYNINVVPVYIFEPSVIKTKSWIQIPDLVTAFDKLSDGSYKLKDEVTGANYFVSEEARKAHYSAIGVTLGDNKPQIDFFVMSYCPYGNQAEIGIEPVYRLLKGKADFNPRYVIYENYGGGGPDYCLDSGKICSMHGIQELNQNIREACVGKYMGVDKWFDFALAMNDKCTYKNADSCWEAVAKELKLDVNKIKTCEKDEGLALMRADKALGDKLAVQGSPSVFIDGQSYNGGRTPEAYKQGLCAAFTNKPAECNTALAGEANAAPAAGSC
jgi:2-hydroxychromene-2-carboxylate isomerase